jgi:hypothetical protein
MYLRRESSSVKFQITSSPFVFLIIEVGYSGTFIIVRSIMMDFLQAEKTFREFRLILGLHQLTLLQLLGQ